MRRKIMSLLVVIAMCFTLIPANYIFAAQVITNNQTGNQNGYDYELWKDYGNTSMTLNSPTTFSCQWSNIGNALFRIGKKFGSTKTYQELGNISVNYACDYNPNGNSYLCVYGWTKSPLVEYYVVDSWGTWRPPGATAKGQITVDGGTYDVYETTRVNQPSIEGDTTFKQYWSVRTSKRTSGTISLSEHFKKWESMGLKMGKMYEAALTVEGYQSSGSANVTKNEIVVGGSSSGSGNTNTPVYSSGYTNTADVSWINPSSKLVALSFDDGPVNGGSSATRIQDVMKKYNMHCTFFYWGNRITGSNTAEIQRAYQMGCEVANHTYTHSYLTNMSSAQIKDEIGKVNNVLKGISGKSSNLIRPPYLATNSTVTSSVDAPLITCSVDSKDWDGASKDQIISNVLNNVTDGSIVLMHETYDTTAAAVEYLVPELIKRGYTIVTVSELAKMKNYNMRNGQVIGQIQGANRTDLYQNGGSSSSGNQGGQTTPVTPSGNYATLNEGWYYIKDSNSQNYLQVANNTGSDGQNVEVGKGTGVEGQKWYLKNVGDGYVTLKNGTGYALDVVNGENEDSTNVQVYTPHGLTAQLFKLIKTQKDGQYGIVTKCSSDTKGLDVENESTTPGANVQQYSYWGGANQVWVLEPCNKSEEGSGSGTGTTPVQPATDSVSAKITSDWGSGAVADITVKNTTGRALNNWTCTFTTSRPITSVWNATIVSQSGNTYTVTGPAWQTSLANGASYTFGCQLGGGSGLTVSNATLK